jgi:hypothetical protein
MFKDALPLDRKERVVALRWRSGWRRDAADDGTNATDAPETRDANDGAAAKDDAARVLARRVVRAASLMVPQDMAQEMAWYH